MGTKKTAVGKAPAAKKTNRVWIELERPSKLPQGQVNEHGGGTDLTHAEEVCKRANNMLLRLMPGTSFRFWWNARKALYSLTTDEAGGYIDLRDNGHWFNLDHLGRDPERRRLNLRHKHGGSIIDIVAIGHATYQGGASWFFKGRCEWPDGSHLRDPEHLYEIAPINLAYGEGVTEEEREADARKAIELLNDYLKRNGRWDSKHQWIPYYKEGEEKITL